jgi:hypothetical protein
MVASRARAGATSASRTKRVAAPRSSLSESIEDPTSEIRAETAALRREIIELKAKLAASESASPPSDDDPGEKARVAASEQERKALGDKVERLNESLAALRTQMASFDRRGRGIDTGPMVGLQPTDSRDAVKATAGPKRLGVEIDLGVASIYAYRGINVYKAQDQSEANALFSPSITWTIGETGVSLGYVGVYQMTGANRSALVDSGVGHEQNLALSYARSFSDRITGAASLTYTAFPFAKASVAGTTLPSYLEVGVGASYAGPVDVALSLSYLAGVQEVLAESRHAYARPSVAKTIEIASGVELSLAGGAGFKLYTTERDTTDNVVDISLDAKVRLRVGDRAYVSPAVHYGWTNLDDLAFADEQMVWGSLNTGLSL